VEKVEQVAASRGGAVTDTAALDWVVRRNVLRDPGIAAVERVGDIQIPDAFERSGVTVRIIARSLADAAMIIDAAGCRSKKGERGAVRISCDYRGEDDVIDSAGRRAAYIRRVNADIDRGRPVYASIVRNRNSRMSILRLHAHVNRSVGCDADRRVAITLRVGT